MNHVTPVDYGALVGFGFKVLPPRCVSVTGRPAEWLTGGHAGDVLPYIEPVVKRDS